MAMLAEPRQRKRYNLVPRGKPLYEDGNRFGTKMLEKMGWEKGKGLGANESGSKDFVRIRYKNDILGLGFQHRDDQWTQHEQCFSGLLKTLNNEEPDNCKMNQENACESEDEIPRVGFGFQDVIVKDRTQSKMENLKEKISGVSLEERSKQSRARVHYKKFTKGKDLSQYSEKDLANIFGKKVTDEQQAANDFYHQLTKSFAKNDEDKKNDEKEEEPIKGVQIINTGVSVSDYFKKKMNLRKQKRSEADFPCNEQFQEGVNDKIIINSKDSNVEDGKHDQVEKKDGQMIYSSVSLTDYFKIKMEAVKNKKNSLCDENNDKNNIPDKVEEENLKKKKKSKVKSDKTNANEVGPRLGDEEVAHQDVIKKEKKSKKRDIVETIEMFNEETKSKKKKSKKRKHEEIEPQTESYIDQSNENLAARERNNESSPTGTISLDSMESSVQKYIAEETPRKKHKKSKNKESTEIIEKDDNSGKTVNTTFENEDSIEAKFTNNISKKSKKTLRAEENLNQIEITNGQASKNPSKKTKSKKVVSFNAKKASNIDVNIELLSLDELRRKYTSFNIFPISSFCAEKFRNTNLNNFTGSILPQITGYGLGPDIQLDVYINKNDEERITNLWKCALNKYVHLEKPKKTYQHYVREVIKACKTKQKKPKLYVKTWKRKNAFQML